MSRLPLLLLAVAVVAAWADGRAQEIRITVDTKAAPEDIHTWLGSGDPRLVAWGAYFARIRADDEALAQMVQLAESWTPAEVDQGPDDRLRIDAMSVVLDTLIQRNAQISSEGLAAIAASFPSHAAILAARLPIADATPVLLKWYGEGSGKDSTGLERIAAMMLAKTPPSGFAASVLAASEEKLLVYVVDEGGRGGGGGSMLCGDGFGIGAGKGWAPLYAYRMEENKPSTSDPLVIEAGGDRITYHRIGEREGWGSCFAVRSLNNATRYDLLAELLGVERKDISLKLEKTISIQWEGNQRFALDLLQQVDAEETLLHATVASLFAKGYLTDKEARSVRPRLSVTVCDMRKQTATPLPRLASSDPRTEITFAPP